MSRRKIYIPNNAQVVVEGLYRDLERRIESSPAGLCPVDMSKAFLELCHAQTCGKCVPCRIGLGQLKNLIADVLDGKATIDILRLMEDTALSIMRSSDCAIGYEAANMVYKGLIGYREDYVNHIEQGRCTCTYKHPVPCVALCPAEVDIPGYIALVGEGRYEDAIRLIRKDNPLPTTCAFICENPCEARCRRDIVDFPVNIRGLKRMAVDQAGHVPPPACAPSTGKRVAIIGGGPTGLSAAYYLQLMGHQTVIYESLAGLGGMLRYGIPNYRLPKDRLDDDINVILETGVQIKHNVVVGQDTTIAHLRKEYDAVFIAIGASIDKKLGMDNESAEGIISAITLLREVAEGKKIDFSGKEVAVIGGGNVAMDAVRTAVRLNAKKVSIVYRRRIADMTALYAEIEGAVSEGVEMVTLKAPAKIELDDSGKLTGLSVIPQMISRIKDGRASVKATGEDNSFIPAQILIVAIGQDVEFQHFLDFGMPVDRGAIKALDDCSFEDLSGVFAGGDCASGPATVIKAIAAAKVAAANIDEYLGYHHTISCDVEVPIPRIDNRLPCGRVNLPEREGCERIHDFEAVELCMASQEANQEATRCLRCDHFGYGIFKGGRERIW